MFGLPIRWATYDPTNPKLLDDIIDMLENMGSAGWGAFPAGTTLELKEAVKDAANNPQSFLMSLADISADILILGQTLTTEQGQRGSQALGRVHQDMRAEVIDVVARWWANVLNYQFVPALMRLNFGHNEEDPISHARHRAAAEEKALAMAQRDQIIVSAMQVPVPAQWFYERHDIPMPREGGDILVVPQASPPGGMKGEGGGMNSGGGDNVSARHGPSRTGITAKFIPGATPAEMAANDRLIDNVMENLTGVQAKWLSQVKPFFAQLLAYAKSDQVTDAQLADTIKESARIMPELFSKLDGKALEDALYGALSAGLVNGVARGVLARSQPPAQRGLRPGGRSEDVKAGTAHVPELRGQKAAA